MFNLFATGDLPVSFTALIIAFAIFCVTLAVYLFLLFYFKSSYGLERRKAQKRLDSQLSDSFLKIRRKRFLAAMIKSIVCGVAFGLVVVGVVLLALKLNAIYINIAYYVIIFLVVALLGFGLTYLIIKPTNKKVAKELDNDYVLHERVQTSLAFAGEEGSILELQREDTDEKLKAVPRRRLSFARMWQYCVIAVLAVAIIFTSIFIPGKTVAGSGSTEIDPDDVIYMIDPIDIKALRELKDNIYGAGMESYVAYDSGEEIESLATFFEESLLAEEYTLTVGQMRERVYLAIENIDAIISGYTSYSNIAELLEEQGESYLSKIIKDGGDVYKLYILVEYQDTKAYNSQKLTIIDRYTTGTFSEYSTDLLQYVNEDLSGKLGEIVTVIRKALFLSGVENNDNLYKALADYASNLKSLKDSIDIHEIDEANPLDVIVRLDGFNATFAYKLTEVLVEQAFYMVMDTFVTNKIKKIFELPYETPSENPVIDPVDPDDPDDGRRPGNGDVPNLGDPGTPDGEKIYDPFTRTYVTYSELLDTYYAIVQEYLKTGTLTEEQRNMVNLYFDLLFRGTQS